MMARPRLVQTLLLQAEAESSERSSSTYTSTYLFWSPETMKGWRASDAFGNSVGIES